MIITLATLKNKKKKKKNFFGMWNKILRGKVERTMGKCVNGGQHKKVGNDRGEREVGRKRNRSFIK